MARYIDADMLKTDIDNCFDGNLNRLFKSLVDKEPTVDLQEVKHSQWQKPQFVGRCGFYEIKDFICKECKFFEVLFYIR